jgi:hypothetical protein
MGVKLGTEKNLKIGANSRSADHNLRNSGRLHVSLIAVK